MKLRQFEVISDIHNKLVSIKRGNSLYVMELWEVERLYGYLNAFFESIDEKRYDLHDEQ